MTGAIILSALAMTLIVALRYLATSGLFAWLTARLAAKTGKVAAE